MTLKEQLVSHGFKPEYVPGGYQIIGDILLAKFPASTQKKKIAKAIAKILPNVRVVCEIKRIGGEFRKPKIAVLFSKRGKSLETIHIENGVRFALDVSKIMFSKGNLAERARLISKVRPDEVIIDMFAGIGYFSLGLAKSAAKIYSIEKNPVALKYLKQNIALNGISDIVAIRGDCRKAKIEEKADRVLMGYFPGTQKFLPAAFKFLKSHGVIHYHNIYNEQAMRTKPIDELEAAAKKAGYKIVGFAQHVVKSYAPHVWHIVVDAEVKKETGTKEFYDKTAEIYDLRQKNAWTHKLRETEIKLLDEHTRGSVLDIGCGTGFHLAWLSENKPECKLTGLDISKDMLRSAKHNAPAAKFVDGKAEQLPFEDNIFDTAICMFSTLNLCDYTKALAEMFRVLRPNGKLILSVSSVWDNDGKPEKRIRIEKEILRLHLFDANELKKELERTGFKIISFDSLFRAKRPRWGDWTSQVEDDFTQPVERGAMYLCVVEKV
jgi:tRNA wybutosine-synthesizing protein 2